MRNLTRDEARERAALIRVTSYEVALDLSESESYGSVSTIRFRSGEGQSFLELDAELVRADLDGETVTIEGNRLVLDLTEGEHVATVVARCVTTTSGEGLHRHVDPADGNVYLYAQSFLDDAQRIFACFDQPDLKATYQLTVDAPEGWTVLSNTAAAQDGRRHVFPPTERISTYLMVLAAGPWHGERTTYAGLDLGVWCRASMAPSLEADELFTVTKQCLDFQQGIFGRPYPFGPSYDQVFVPEFNAGAMENPGMVTFNDEVFLFRSRATRGQRRLRAQVIAHEMAHMWFGDLVTMRWWDDLWLNESFAEYLGVLTVERATDYEGAWADVTLSRKAWGYRADQLPTTHPIAGDVADNRSALLNFDGISYAKGAAALKQLSARLGEDVFFAGVRSYLDRHAWGNTGLVDLLTALEETSGQDLGAWAKAWLQTTGPSELTLADGVLRATGDRPHTVGVAAYDGDPLRQTVRRLVEVTSETPVDLRGDLVLPNDGDLTFAKVRLDPRSLATARDRLRTLADPLARALVWSSLWDMTRDGELSAAQLVKTVLSNVDGESDPDLVTTLLQQARQAAELFIVDGAGLLAALLTHHTTRLHPAGSDLQLVLYRAAVEVALEAPPVPDGLRLDDELQWLLRKREAALGRTSAENLRQAYDQAPSQAAEVALAYGLAALPDAATKAAVWEELVGDAPLSNSRARALAAGFWQHGQDEVLAPYVERYVHDVPGSWDRRSPQLAWTVSRLLFPSTIVRQDVLDRTAPLTTGTGPAGLRRVVLEARDDLARALEARQAFPI